MKNMRQLLNLMEGVIAVPGIGQLDEKSTSEKQARFMAAAAHDPKFAKKTGMDTSVAKEFNKADTGTKQLSNAMKHKEEESCQMDEAHVDTCRMDNPASARDACAMEGIDDPMGAEQDPGAMAMGDVGAEPEGQFNSPEVDQAMDMFSNLVNNSFVEPERALTMVMDHCRESGLGEDELACVENAIMDHYGVDVAGDHDGAGLTDVAADAAALASAGWGSDEDYGGGDEHFEEAFDLNNGYDEIKNAKGDDFFPNGADSPVVRTAGPSGARQGDNPEQKKMEVTEVHKELVYGYRNFLKESNQKKK